MRLTSDIILCADTSFNTYKDREVSLRGHKISVIENLSVLRDTVDVIDLSDNEIRKLDNLPKMSRLTTLLLNNNLISKISDRIGSYVDNVRFLILTNNKIANLAEIDHIATLQHLEHLSLLENPVTSKLHYRLYIIHRIKSIKTIDYQKVTKTEREQSAAFFQSPAGVAMLGAIAPAEEAGGAAASGQPVPGGAGRKVAMVLTDEQKAFIRAKIEAASTRDEIEEIEQQLKSGTIKFA